MINHSSLQRFAWLLLTPAIMVIGVSAIFPISYAVYLSFFDRNLAHPRHSRFVGLDNYYTVFSDAYWWHALQTTITITVVSVCAECIIGLAIAVVMHSTKMFSSVVRIAVLIPYAIVTVVSSYSWLYAWTPKIGYISYFLPSDYAPLSHHYGSLVAICISEIWKTTPFVSLLLLSGISLIPEDVLVAAKLEGANFWQRLRRIIIPMIMPSLLVAILFRTVDTFRIFDNIYIMTGGNNDTYSVSILGYDNLFQIFNVGLGSAISVLILVCIALLALLLSKVFSVSLSVGNHE